MEGGRDGGRAGMEWATVAMIKSFRGMINQSKVVLTNITNSLSLTHNCPPSKSRHTCVQRAKSSYSPGRPLGLSQHPPHDLPWPPYHLVHVYKYNDVT